MYVAQFPLFIHGQIGSSPVLYLPSDDGVRGQRNRAQLRKVGKTYIACSDQLYSKICQPRALAEKDLHFFEAYPRVKYMDHYQCCYECQCQDYQHISKEIF